MRALAVASAGSDLRQVMRNFATGVCIATTYRDLSSGREDDAVTINSLTSVSINPPLVSLCLRPDSAFLADLRHTGKWAVSILDAGAEDVAKALAKGREARRVAIRTLSARRGAHSGALILDAPSWVECVLSDLVPLGDHVMAVGEVVGMGIQRRRPPLIFLDGTFRLLDCA